MGGRLATEVTPEDRMVRLEYRPALLAPGIALSIATLLGLGGWMGWDLRRGRA